MFSNNPSAFNESLGKVCKSISLERHPVGRRTFHTLDTSDPNQCSYHARNNFDTYHWMRRKPCKTPIRSIDQESMIQPDQSKDDRRSKSVTPVFVNRKQKLKYVL